MSAIFRVSTGVRRDPAVDAWLNEGHRELCKIARQWFTQMRRCGEDVLESIHDGCPVACVEDAPFAYVDSFESHVNVGFFNGAMLDDPTGLLEGSGKRMRHVKLTPDAKVDGAALRGLIKAAYADIKMRLG
jgi:hypothetical protein